MGLRKQAIEHARKNCPRGENIVTCTEHQMSHVIAWSYMSFYQITLQASITDSLIPSTLAGILMNKETKRLTLTKTMNLICIRYINNISLSTTVPGLKLEQVRQNDSHGTIYWPVTITMLIPCYCTSSLGSDVLTITV